MTDSDIIDGDFREVTEDNPDPDAEKNTGGVSDAGHDAGNSADHTGGGDSENAGDTENRGGTEDGGEYGGRENGRFCMMCRRPESKTGKLIELPGGMYVCTDCMQKSFDTMKNTGMTDLISTFPSNVGMIDLSGLLQGRQMRNRGKDPRADENVSGKEDRKKLTLEDIPAPHVIKAEMDEYVVGQEHAKKEMAVAVYNHYKRILQEPSDSDDGVDIQKSNMLMIGPTGSGKTYLVQTMARLLDVPLALTDATSLTEAGYIGDDIESVVSKLLAAADGDVERAEHGIIFIDEIDKIAKKRNTNQRDVSGEAVQQGLLKLLEGSEIEVPVGATSKNAMVPLETVNTKNILFICGGAFPDLGDIIRERLNKTSSIGFQADLRDRYDDDRDILKKVTVDDLREFGMIPEFLGRLPVIFSLDALSEDMLVEILKEPRNAIIRQYQKLLAMDHVELVFEDDALHSIARQAMARDTGARALRSVIEDFMLDIMYEVPKDKNIKKVIITKDYVEHKGNPVIL